MVKLQETVVITKVNSGGDLPFKSLWMPSYRCTFQRMHWTLTSWDC